jgi:hypothetical protein
MPEHIDNRVQSAIDYYLRVVTHRQVIHNELQQLAITEFNLSDVQIAEFRLKIYQLHMKARYIDLNKHST